MADLVNLRIESQAAPAHFGALMIVEAAPLLDPDGRLCLGEIRGRLELRLSRVAELRRRIHDPGFLRGRPLWVDDPAFDIGRHVLTAEVDPPGGEARLMKTASRLIGNQLDRSRPLWELWFITGVGPEHLGVLLKLHHTIADGMGAVAIMGSLLDLEPDAPDPAPVAWWPEPVPPVRRLVMDSLATKAKAIWRIPAGLADGGRDLAWSFRQVSAAPRTSLNRPVRAGRAFRWVRLNLDAVKTHAHASGGKINDVVLDLAAGGLRELLLERGEMVAGMTLRVTVPVSLRSDFEPNRAGNETGIMTAPLPVGELDASRRLEAIIAASKEAKSRQHPAHTQAVFAALAATPILHGLMNHQHMVNTLVTNVVGPPAPLYVLGARILDVVPITQVAGNVTVDFAALSYDGRLYLVVNADSTACPDIDVIVTGIERTWDELEAAARLAAAV